MQAASLAKRSAVRLLLAIVILLNVVNAAEPCIKCEEMAGAQQSVITLSVNYPNNTINAFLYYENYSAPEPYVPINNSIMFVHVMSGEGEEELFRIYTDERGFAKFDFSDYASVEPGEKRTIYTFRFIYCSFCNPAETRGICGFEECMKYAGINASKLCAGGPCHSADDVTLGKGVVPISTSALNNMTALPTSKSMTYIPPPPPTTGAETPAFCLPLILIFALLGGALYYTGRNPFAAFSISTPRVGRHVRYTPLSKGYAVSGRMIIESVVGGAKEVKGAAKTVKEAEKKVPPSPPSKRETAKRALVHMAKETFVGGGIKKQLIKTLMLGTGERMGVTATGKGGVVVSGPVGPRAPAKEALLKARAQFVAGKKELTESGAAFAKKVAIGALANVGIGLLSSMTTLNALITLFSPNAFERMLRGVEKRVLKDADVYAAEREIRAKEYMKISGGKAVPEIGRSYIDENENTVPAEIKFDKEKKRYTTTVYLEGYKEPIEISWSLDANKNTDFIYRETIASGPKKGAAIEVRVENKRIAKAMEIGKDGKIVDITEMLRTDKSVLEKTYGIPLEKIGSKSKVMIKYNMLVEMFRGYNEACEHLAYLNRENAMKIAAERFGVKKAAEEYSTLLTKAVDNLKISQESKEILLTLPRETHVEKNIENIMKKAKEGYVQDIQMYAMNKWKVEKEAKTDQVAALNVLKQIQYDLPNLNTKNKYVSVVKEYINNTELSDKQKEAAIKNCEVLWGKDGKELRRIAETWDNASNQAAKVYSEFEKLQNDAFNKSFKPVYESFRTELKTEELKTKELKTEELKAKELKAKDYLKDAVLSSGTIDPIAISEKVLRNAVPLAKTPEEKFLLFSAVYGASKLETEKRPEESDEEYEKRLKDELSRFYSVNTGGSMVTTAIGQHTILSAMKKYKLPDDVYNNAVKTIENGDTKGMKDAIKVVENMVMTEKKVEERRTEELKSLGEEI
ncbi:MAG: hypothetical protein QW171_03945 [Candidatus Bilamarchaeaceae archaeon]